MHRRPCFGIYSRGDKRRRHDTDDGVHVAAERNCFTENLLVAIELFDPYVVAQHHDERSTVFVIFASDETSTFRFDAKSFKEPAGNLSNLKLNWFTAGRIGQRLHNHAAKRAEG